MSACIALSLFVLYVKLTSSTSYSRADPEIFVKGVEAGGSTPTTILDVFFVFSLT